VGQVDLKPSFFRTLAAQKDRYLIWACLLALFLGGAYLWVVFLHFGINLMTYGDWARITGPRLTLVRDAMLQGTLPFHGSGPKGLYGIPRYFSVPDAIASPQVILLRFMTVEQFTIVNTLLLYGLGFWGLLRIRSRYHLSLLPFSLLFLLYNFNGHILAHFTAGHANWWSNFLFIWLILWILDAVQNGGGWQWVLKISLLLLVIFLQGGYHQFIWSLFFIGIIGLSYPRLFLLMLKTAVASVALSLVRLLPTLLVAGQFHTTIYGGYPTLLSVWTNLVVPAQPGQFIQTMRLNDLYSLGSWESSLYVGLLGAFFLLGFGVFYLLKDKQRPNLARLLLPCAGMLLLSMGWIFSHLSTYLPLPIFTGEEVSARFIILPFLTVLALAAIECQRWLDSRPVLALQWLFAAGLALEANDLALNFRTWQIGLAAKQFPAKYFDPTALHIANDYHDYAYFAALGTGLLLSLLCLAVLIFLSKREGRSSSKYSTSP
jgi:hypothetical protein